MKWLTRIGSIVFLNVSAVISIVFFRVFNRTQIVGTENLPAAGSNVLFVANHVSIIDSFLLSTVALYPAALSSTLGSSLGIQQRKRSSSATGCLPGAQPCGDAFRSVVGNVTSLRFHG